MKPGNGCIRMTKDGDGGQRAARNLLKGTTRHRPSDLLSHHRNPYMLKFTTLLILIFVSFASRGVTYTYEDISVSVDMSNDTCGPAQIYCTFMVPAKNLTRALVASPSAPVDLKCTADEASLKSTTDSVLANTVIPGTTFYMINRNVVSTNCSTCTMRPITLLVSDVYAEIGSRHTVFCAYGRNGVSLESLPAAASVKILRVTATITNSNPKPQVALQLPGTLDLGNITPDQRVEKTIPVTITCSDCVPGYRTPGTMTWRLESSPDNPTAERPGVLFQGAESDAAEGTNVVTMRTGVTELSDYRLRWPRTNSAPLTPGDYRWTLTMTLSVQ